MNPATHNKKMLGGFCLFISKERLLSIFKKLLLRFDRHNKRLSYDSWLLVYLNAVVNVLKLIRKGGRGKNLFSY